jgi:hypothetical protein
LNCKGVIITLSLHQIAKELILQTIALITRSEHLKMTKMSKLPDNFFNDSKSKHWLFYAKKWSIVSFYSLSVHTIYIYDEIMMDYRIAVTKVMSASIHTINNQPCFVFKSLSHTYVTELWSLDPAKTCKLGVRQTHAKKILINQYNPIL